MDFQKIVRINTEKKDENIEGKEGEEEGIVLFLEYEEAHILRSILGHICCYNFIREFSSNLWFQLPETPLRCKYNASIESQMELLPERQTPGF